MWLSQGACHFKWLCMRNSFLAQAAGHALGALIEFGREAEIGVQERHTATIDLGAVQELRDHMCDLAR
jgi:hypothetical protein